MSKSQELIVVGAGGFGREVLALARLMPEKWRVMGFLDDDKSLHGREIGGVAVMGAGPDWTRLPDARFVVAVGNSRVRRDIIRAMTDKGKPTFATLIHPGAEIMERVHVGGGSIICSGVRLTVDINVGRHAIVNVLSTVGHDSVIGDYTTLAPHVALSGNVMLGEGVEVGTAAVLVPGISVGAGSCICAGAVVTKDLPENIVVAGAPCRRAKSLEPFRR